MTSTSRLQTATVLLLGLQLSISVAPVVADKSEEGAKVRVALRDAAGNIAEGRVGLESDAGKEVASCSTKLGKCEMGLVPGGTYLATVKPEKGAAPKPRKVMIPPSGDVSLVLSTGE